MSHTSHAPIAVLDSGVGGIGVLREVKRLLPSEQLYYFGDSANAPYGERDPREIEALVMAHAERLLARCKALVLACNTATAVAVDRLRAQYPATPILGIEPALRPALRVAPHPHVLVLATAATLRQPKFAQLVAAATAATVTPIAAPGLVRLVEAGKGSSPEAVAYLRELLSPLSGRPDAVVLGCTHFPFAAESIRQVLGAEVPLFDGAAGTAKELCRRLRAAGLLYPTHRHGTVTLASSAPDALPLYRDLLQRSQA